MSVRTLRRWRVWWQGEFVRTRFWRAAGGRFVPPVEGAALPTSLLARFAGEAAERLERARVFLSPVTTRSATRAGRAV